MLSDFGGGKNSGCQKLSFYGAVHITLQDSSVRGVAMGECCSRGSSIDVHERSAMVYLLVVGESFRDQ